MESVQLHEASLGAHPWMMKNVGMSLSVSKMGRRKMGRKNEPSN